MLGAGNRSLCLLAVVGLAAGCAGFMGSVPPLPRYTQTLVLRPGEEWRFHPLLVDFNGDGHLDLAATARLVEPALHIWLGNGTGALAPMAPSWSDIGYGALAAGDINRDGFLDVVGASHFGKIQTLLSDGRGGFGGSVLPAEDGYVGAQLADLNGDGQLDLVLLGYQRAGVEVYLGDGTANWRLHARLQPQPRRPMPGRALALGDLNRDGHLDIVAAFQRWGLHVYYGNGRGTFTGGRVELPSTGGAYESVALGDVNKDGHPDLVINGTFAGPNQPNGPDVYLGDGQGGWRASSTGLKVLRYASAGVALGDLDRDGNLDIVATGRLAEQAESGYGLFWFRGDGKGGWRLVSESGLPKQGLSLPHSVTLADIDRDGNIEIVSVHGGTDGRIIIWKRG